jgi:hypothetical protein
MPFSRVRSSKPGFRCNSTAKDGADVSAFISVLCLSLCGLYQGLPDAGVTRGVQLLHLFVTEAHIKSGDIFLQLIDLAARNNRKDCRLALPHPGHDDLVKDMPCFFRNVSKSIETFI